MHNPPSISTKPSGGFALTPAVRSSSRERPVSAHLRHSGTHRQMAQGAPFRTLPAFA